jgi:hypothetical protein
MTSPTVDLLTYRARRAAVRAQYQNPFEAFAEASRLRLLQEWAAHCRAHGTVIPFERWVAECEAAP